MGYAVIHRFEGGTKEQFEATLAAVHPGGQLAEGQRLLAAGPQGDGWTVLAVFESEDAYASFRDGTLTSALGSAEGGFAGPPQETAFSLEHLQVS